MGGRMLRGEEGASIAGAFEGSRNGVLRQPFEIVERDLQWFRNQAGDIQPVGCGVNGGR